MLEHPASHVLLRAICMNTTHDTMTWVRLCNSAAGVVCCTVSMGISAGKNTHPAVQDGWSAYDVAFLRQEHLGPKQLQRKTLHAWLQLHCCTRLKPL